MIVLFYLSFLYFEFEIWKNLNLIVRIFDSWEIQVHRMERLRKCKGKFKRIASRITETVFASFCKLTSIRIREIMHALKVT